MVDVKKQKLNAIIEHSIRLRYPIEMLEKMKNKFQETKIQIPASSYTISGRIEKLIESNSIPMNDANAILIEIDKINVTIEKINEIICTEINKSQDRITYHEQKILENLGDIPEYDPSKAVNKTKKSVSSQKNKFLRDKDVNLDENAEFQTANKL